MLVKRMNDSRPQLPFFLLNWETETQVYDICSNFMKLVCLEAGTGSDLRTFLTPCFPVAAGFSLPSSLSGLAVAF